MISSSNSPSVFGLVSIIPATSSSSTELQAVEVDQTALVRRNCDHLEPTERHRSGVSAVCRVGDDHLGPLVALGRVPGAHEKQAGQLPCRAGGRLKCCRRHAGDLAESLFELDEQLEPTLGAAFRGARVNVGEPG